MKVALVGNMNNNFFALMRYLRDCGVDAHLLMYQNEHAHFFPEYDTHDIEKWTPYINMLPFENNVRGVIKTPRKILRKVFSGYDVVIGCGITPAFFNKINRSLDIFIPYDEFVEFISTLRPYRWAPKSWLSASADRLAKHLQLKGLSKTKMVTALVMYEKKEQIYRSLPAPYTNLALPMIYNKEPVLEVEALDTVYKRMQESSFVVMSHSRQLWKTLPTHFKGKSIGACNHYLIEGFAEFVRQSADADACLVMFDYGVDVEYSKALVEKLGISQQVCWVSRSPRKAIMSLMPYVTVGGGEFGQPLWGGVTWEYISAGVPVLNAFNEQIRQDYETYTKTPAPPILAANSPAEITAQLMALHASKAKRDMLAATSLAWFDQYFGLALTKKYLDLIKDLTGFSPNN